MVAAIAFEAEEMRHYAAKAGLGLQFVVKEAFLFELMELFSEKEFVLKGGTAINKGFLRGHQRFSEDLDYDSGCSEGEVRGFVRSLGWSVKKEFHTKHSTGFMLEYYFNGVRDTVKAEVSFGIQGKHEKTRMESDFLPVSKRVNAYVFSELNKQKEDALIERREWKDLYDLYWMKELNPKEFRLRKRGEFSKALKDLQVEKTANAYIPSNKRPNWQEVREKMIEYAQK